MLSRIKALQKHIAPDQAFLLTSPTDIQYYADFEWLVPAEREAFLLLTQTQAYLLYASFSPVKQVPHITLYAGCYPNQVVSHLNAIRQNDPFSTLLIDAEAIYLHEYQALTQIANLTFENLDTKLVWQQRMVKDAAEIELIQRAVAISLQAYEELLPQLKIGMTEQDVKVLLENSCKAQGAETMAFPTIVAFGAHSALPHYQPADTRLTDSMAILLDFGAKYKNYCSDMTRTLWFGSAPPESFLKIETIIKTAYEASLSLVRNGQEITAQKVDQAARDTIDAEGYGAYYIHTTGHGLGLDIHEQPSLNWKNQTIIQKNMVITIEPGIYLQDEFGYRYENTIIV